MGGGPAMSVAGIGAFNAGMRGGLSSATAGAPAPPASRSLRNVLRSVGGILSSGNVSAGGDVVEAQKASWELDDWEFSGGGNDFLVAPQPESTEPIARLVFGRAPSLEEAKEATSELKEAVETVYFSSKNSSVREYDGMVAVANSDSVGTKSCISCDPKSVTVPQPAIQAFKFLSENAEAQSVVAEIAADPNVWNAVMQNEALMQFIQSHRNNDTFQDQGSPGKFDELSDLSKEDTGSHSGDSRSQSQFNPMAFLHNIKDRVVKLAVSTRDRVVKPRISTTNRVVEMVSNVGDYLPNIFGMPAADKTSAEPDAKPSNFHLPNFFGMPAADNTSAEPGAKPSNLRLPNFFGLEYFMGLAIMVILVILLKRP